MQRRMRTIKWLYCYAKGKKNLLLIGSVLIFLNAVVEILKIESQKSIIDGYLKNEPWTKVICFVVLSASMYIFSSILFYAIGVHFQKISFSVCEKITLRLHKKIQNMRLEEYNQQRFGHWMTVFNDIDGLANDLFRIPYMLIDMLKLLMISILLFATNHQVLWLMIGMNVFFLLFMKLLLPRVQQIGREMIYKRHELMAYFEDGNSGLREIINYQYQSNFVNNIKLVYQKYLMSVRKDIFWSNATEVVSSLSKWIGFALGIYYLYQDVAMGKITVGAFFVGYQYMNQFTELFRYVNRYIYEMIGIHAKVSQVQDMMESIREEDFEKGMRLEEKIQEFLLHDIHFSYDGKKEILHGINAAIQVNQTNVIVGESGKGKSTFLELLLKNYEVTQGEIVINHIYRLNQISKESWREKILIVYQNPYIFHDSIRNNILLGKENVTDEILENVIEMVMLKEFVDSLPSGIDTVIEEQGISISGGQRQKITIARALIRNTEILILDEALSAVDETNQRIILENIERGRPECTMIMVTHSSSLLNPAYHMISL